MRIKLDDLETIRNVDDESVECKYEAIKELDKRLTKLKISHDIEQIHNGYRITVPVGAGNRFEGDEIEHRWSYGSEDDLIEVWGFDLEDPVGYLTVDQALKYFVEWDCKQKKQQKG